VGGSYLPVANAYPVGGYEVDVTPFTPDAAQVVVDESLVLLRELAKKATSPQVVIANRISP
jgi:hypothetical protein